MVKKVCEYCRKEFEGINEAQVESQVLMHKFYKHKDKLNIIEGKNEKKK